MIRIAVYGTLRRGFGNYEYHLADQDFIGEQVLDLPFKMISLGGFPGLLESDEMHSTVIEIFDVDEEAFRSVDSLESYPRFYNRKQIDTEFGKAWVYFLVDKTRYVEQKLVPNGDWKEYVQVQRDKRIRKNEVFSQD